jgi:hypothetical protein
MLKQLLVVTFSLVSVNAFANVSVPVTGTVESKCVLVTDTVGIYGNPLPNTLSTDPIDGGVIPIVRYDVLQANFYKAKITYPNTFSESPDLVDVVNWTGDVTVGEVSDATMSGYDTSKIEYNNVTEVDLTIAGSTWFKIESEAEYGYDRAFPAGTYRTVVTAECIAL